MSLRAPGAGLACWGHFVQRPNGEDSRSQRFLGWRLWALPGARPRPSLGSRRWAVLWMLVGMRSHGPSKAPVSPRKPRSLGPCCHAPSPERGPASAGEQGPHTCSWVPPHCDFPLLIPSQPLAPESPQDTFWATSSKWEESGGAPVAKSSHFYFLPTKPPRHCSANVSKAWTLADWSGYLGPKTTS